MKYHLLFWFFSLDVFCTVGSWDYEIRIPLRCPADIINHTAKLKWFTLSLDSQDRNVKLHNSWCACLFYIIMHSRSSVLNPTETTPPFSKATSWQHNWNNTLLWNKRFFYETKGLLIERKDWAFLERGI